MEHQNKKPASRREQRMISVCCYKGCGVAYGEKEPLSDKRITYGLCPKHLKISLKEIKAKMEKNSMVNNVNELRLRTDRGRSSGQDGHPG
jgi:hypothetical protein